MTHPKLIPALLLAAAATTAPATAELLAPKVLTQPRQLTPQAQGPLAVKQREEVQRLMNLETAAKAQRLQALQSTLQARKVADSGPPGAITACAQGPRITEVTPTTLMPGDPVRVRGCGFTNDAGMLLLSDGNRQLTVTNWTSSVIDAVLPSLTGFAEPKTVTLAVVTVTPAKSPPSTPLTLKPALVLKEIVPTGFVLSGCGDAVHYGIVQHAVQPGDPANCTQGEDTVKFGIELKNNWTFHSLLFTKLCTAAHTPCSATNNATPAAGTYQIGKTVLPDLKVSWKGYVGYYPAIMAMGPEGTEPQ